jgi:hypothetical protein
MYRVTMNQHNSYEVDHIIHESSSEVLIFYDKVV